MSADNPEITSDRESETKTDETGTRRGHEDQSKDENIPTRELISSIDQDNSDQRAGFLGISVTAGMIVLFLFVRVLAVSDWNWDTAADVADSFNFDDSVSIAFGTLFERPHLTGIVISLILPAAMFRLYWLRKDKERNGFADWFIVVTLALTLFVIVNSFSIWWPIYVSGVLLVLFAIASFFLDRGRGRKFFSRLGKHAGTALLVAMLVISLTINTPWMPMEKIETTNHGTIYGYVLETDPGFLKIMAENREVTIVTTAEVQSRTVYEPTEKNLIDTEQSNEMAESVQSQ